MSSRKQIAKEILKELTEEELKKLANAKFDTNKPDYTDEWYYMRKRFESIFNHFLIDDKERDKKTSEVIVELKLLKNERLRDPSETDKYKKTSNPIKGLHKIKYPDAYNDNKPEVALERDEEGNIYHKIKEPKNPEISRTKKTIPQDAENAELFPELFNKPK